MEQCSMKHEPTPLPVVRHEYLRQCRAGARLDRSFCVLSSLVSQRTQETGFHVRSARRRKDVLGMVLSEVFGW